MHYFITGAAGFIGYFTVKTLLRSGHSVTGMDSVNSYYTPVLKETRLADIERTAALPESGTWEFIRGEIEDQKLLEKIFNTHRFDRVINLAAQAGVRYSLENPRAYISSNISGFLNILELCRIHHIAHLAYASSSSVYGMNRKVPFSEKDPVDHPVSLYAATKRANELMAHTYSHLYGLPVTGMRFFTVYGPFGRPDMAYFKFAKAIKTDCPIAVYNNGELLRDFTYIDDIVKAVILIADRPPQNNSAFDPEKPELDISSAPYRVYNIGNAHPEKLMYFIETLEQLLGKKARKNFLPMQPGDVYMTSADTTAIERDFGWKPSTPLAEGLARFCEWASGDGSRFFNNEKQ